jgi:hypothetical protein
MNINNFLTAKEANKIAKKANEKIVEKQFNDIMSGINKNSSIGLYVYHFPGRLLKENKEKIESLGYKVEYWPIDNMPRFMSVECWKIEW